MFTLVLRSASPIKNGSRPREEQRVPDPGTSSSKGFPRGFRARSLPHDEIFRGLLHSKLYRQVGR